MSVHRRTSETAVHRGSRRLGVRLRPVPKTEPRHKAGRDRDAQPAHA